MRGREHTWCTSNIRQCWSTISLSQLCATLFVPWVPKEPKPLTARVLRLRARQSASRLLRARSGVVTRHKSTLETFSDALGDILTTFLPVKLARLAFANADHLGTRDNGSLGFLRHVGG